MSAKKRTVAKNVDVETSDFIVAYQADDTTTKADLFQKLNWEDGIGEDGKPDEKAKPATKLMNKHLARCRTFGLELKKLEGGGSRGRTFNTEAFDAAIAAMAKASGKSVAVVKKEALARREDARLAARKRRDEKNAEKNSG